MSARKLADWPPVWLRCAVSALRTPVRERRAIVAGNPTPAQEAERWALAVLLQHPNTPPPTGPAGAYSWPRTFGLPRLDALVALASAAYASADEETAGGRDPAVVLERMPNALADAIKVLVLPPGGPAQVTSPTSRARGNAAEEPSERIVLEVGRPILRAWLEGAAAHGAVYFSAWGSGGLVSASTPVTHLRLFTCLPTEDDPVEQRVAAALAVAADHVASSLPEDERRRVAQMAHRAQRLRLCDLSPYAWTWSPSLAAKYTLDHVTAAEFRRISQNWGFSYHGRCFELPRALPRAEAPIAVHVDGLLLRLCRRAGLRPSALDHVTRDGTALGPATTHTARSVAVIPTGDYRWGGWSSAAVDRARPR